MLGKHRGLEWKPVEVLGVQWVSVRQTLCAQEKNAGKYEKQLIRRVKKWCRKETAIIGNEKAVLDLELSNMLFYMRKQELLNNVRDIFRYFRDRMGYRAIALSRKEVSCPVQFDRSGFLLVLDSTEWSHKDIVDILWEIKNCFEDIYITIRESVVDAERLVNFFCEECGIVLQILSRDEAKEIKVDAALFLVACWEKSYKRYFFRMGYVVAEWEGEMVRRRRNLHISVERLPCSISNELYSGFVYESKKKQINYEMAITLCSLLGERMQEEENPISIVAIYGVE